MSATNSLGTVYNHPSIISNIVNDDTIFTSTASNRPFFYVIASERGEDNKIKLISGDVNEFLFEYGNPNMKLYGQAAYNIINLLNNEESCYVLRVLPENAGYSHAFLNVQTKVEGTKKVKALNGDLVDMDNVYIRPTVTYSKVNNSSDTLLEYEMSNADRATVDGYRNNMLFYAIPKGRGKYYDKYGFRIYLNESYDSSYDFRVYNFEVIEYDEYENASIIDGPFYVSLDPDSTTASGESMFIEDVVNRYSKYLKVKFNEDAYVYITSLINPKVSPSHIDILSGKTRIYGIDQTETYFDDITQKEEDVHIKLQRYSSTGEPISDGVRISTNIVDSSDDIEANVISIDNSIRSETYEKNLVILDFMKQAISDIYNDTYVTNINAVGTVETVNNKVSFKADSPIIVHKEDASGTWDTLKAEITAFNGNLTESAYATAFATSTVLKTKLSKLMEDLRFLLAYCKVVKNDSLALSVYNDIGQIQNKLDTKEIVAIKLISYKDSLNTSISKLIINKSLQSLMDETNELKIILANNELILNYFKSVLDGYATDASYIKSVEYYNKAVSLIGEIESEFIPDKVKDDYLLDTYDNVENLMTEMVKIANKLTLAQENESGIYLFGDTTSGEAGVLTTLTDSLAALLDGALAIYNTKKGSVELKTEMIKSAKEVAMTQSETTQAARNNIYTSQLQNFNYPIKFAYGSDGDLDSEDARTRTKALENLLIKGYKGLIDDKITSKLLCPARFIMDANYSENVKNAMHTLVTEIRDDIVFYCDLGFTATPEEALAKRKGIANFSDTKIAIYAQDFTIYDEWTGKDIKVTTPFFLSSKIPQCSRSYGLHMPIAGNKRGLLDGFKDISWSPNETYKELLYNQKVNYVESDTRRTRLGSQLTSELRNTPLSNINNVITILDIKNDVEKIAEDYQFELHDSDTLASLSSELNDYLSAYTSSKACERAMPTVYASDYDKLQKIIRISIQIKFYDIIERVLISLDVVKQ